MEKKVGAKICIVKIRFELVDIFSLHRYLYLLFYGLLDKEGYICCIDDGTELMKVIDRKGFFRRNHNIVVLRYHCIKILTVKEIKMNINKGLLK